MPSGVPLPSAPGPGKIVPTPRPEPSGKASPPALTDVPRSPPLLVRSAEQMNGPLPGRHPRARVLTTKGPIVLRLYPEWAPLTVASFLNLADRGFFDGDPLFRVVPDFVVQTGARTPDEDSPYTLGAEENPVEVRAGIISMGLEVDNAGHYQRDTAGTQFYITLSNQFRLDRAFTVFGEVETGWDVLPNLIESDRILRIDRISDD